MRPMKVFISQAMHGKTEEEVMERRKEIIKDLQERYKNRKLEVIDNYTHPDAPEDAGRLWHLGRSIQQMEDADLIVFDRDWYKSNGCQAEYEICKIYNLKMVFEYERPEEIDKLKKEGKLKFTPLKNEKTEDPGYFPFGFTSTGGGTWYPTSTGLSPEVKRCNSSRCVENGKVCPNFDTCSLEYKLYRGSSTK